MQMKRRRTGTGHEEAAAGIQETTGTNLWGKLLYKTTNITAITWHLYHMTGQVMSLLSIGCYSHWTGLVFYYSAITSYNEECMCLYNIKTFVNSLRCPFYPQYDNYKEMTLKIGSGRTKPSIKVYFKTPVTIFFTLNWHHFLLHRTSEVYTCLS